MFYITADSHNDEDFGKIVKWNRQNKDVLTRLDYLFIAGDFGVPWGGNNVRISIVLNRYNINEMDDLIKYCAGFPNVKYIQVRRISTDTRIDYLQEDIDLYEEYFDYIKEKNEQTGEFYLAQQFFIHGKEVNFWRTVETNINSLNYFTDGTCSDEYFIVEGYLKNREVNKL